MSTGLEGWADRLEGVIASGGVRCIDRVAVVASTTSTQDLALAMAAGRPGLLVVAGRQVAGRGRLGRAWADTADHGLAATFVLAENERTSALSIAAGLAACRAVERGVPGISIGLRWPNDVVERGGTGRKIAGVLVEPRGGLVPVGIGVNVLQREEDWPPALRGRAVSLAELGSSRSRLDVAAALIGELDRALGLDPAEVVAAWGERDVLVGTRRTLEHNGAKFAGVVEAIEPTSHILLRTADGVVRLPAATTSLVPDAR